MLEGLEEITEKFWHFQTAYKEKLNNKLKTYQGLVVIWT